MHLFPDLDRIRASFLTSFAIGLAIYVLALGLGDPKLFTSPYLGAGIEFVVIAPLLTAYAVQVILWRRWSFWWIVLTGVGIMTVMFFWPALALGNDTMSPENTLAYFFVFNAIGIAAVAVFSAWFDRLSALIVVALWFLSGGNFGQIETIIEAMTTVGDLDRNTMAWVVGFFISLGPYVAPADG